MMKRRHGDKNAKIESAIKFCFDMLLHVFITRPQITEIRVQKKYYFFAPWITLGGATLKCSNFDCSNSEPRGDMRRGDSK